MSVLYSRVAKAEIYRVDGGFLGATLLIFTASVCVCVRACVCMCVRSFTVDAITSTKYFLRD